MDGAGGGGRGGRRRPWRRVASRSRGREYEEARGKDEWRHSWHRRGRGRGEARGKEEWRRSWWSRAGRRGGRQEYEYEEEEEIEEEEEEEWMSRRKPRGGWRRAGGWARSGGDQEEDEGDESYIKVLPVSDVRYTHDDIKGEFKDGRRLKDLIADLEQKRVKPMRAKFLVLTGFRTVRGAHREPKYFCQNNRRLYCLKAFQDKHPDEVVKVRLRIEKLPARAQKALADLTTTNGGISVEVRGRPAKSSSREQPQGGG